MRNKEGVQEEDVDEMIAGRMLLTSKAREKIPLTGDKASLDRCG